MAQLKLLLSQDVYPSKIDHTMPIERLANTNIKMDERLFKRWLVYEISKWFILAQKYHFKTFNLKKDLKADVYLNAEYKNSYILIRWKKDYDVYPHREFKILIKNSYYTPIPYTGLLKTKSNEIDKPVSFHYQKFMNTIDYFQKEAFKASTPILFTGWTN